MDGSMDLWIEPKMSLQGTSPEDSKESSRALVCRGWLKMFSRPRILVLGKSGETRIIVLSEQEQEQEQEQDQNYHHRRVMR